MRIYTVHLGPQRAPNGRERDVVFVKEGFSWPAFTFAFIWAVVKGMWRSALILFAVQIAVGVATKSFSPEVQGVLQLAMLFLFGAYGNDLQRFELARRGYTEIGVVAAGGLSAAEQRAFEHMPALAKI